MMIKRLLFIVLALCSSALGEIVIEAPKVVGVADLVVVTAKVAEGQTVSWLPIEPRTIKYYLDGNTIVFSSGKDPGSISLICTAVTLLMEENVPTITMEQKWVDIIVAGNPTDPPSDEPDSPKVPDDEFNNIGKKLYHSANTLLSAEAKEVAPEIAKVYRDVASELESGEIGSVISATQEVSKRNKAIYGDEDIAGEYFLVFLDVGKTWREFWPMTTEQVIAFFRAVANGLGAV